MSTWDCCCQEGGAGFGPAAEGDEEAEEDWESASDPDDFDQPQDPLPAGLVISLSEGIFPLFKLPPFPHLSLLRLGVGCLTLSIDSSISLSVHEAELGPA